MTANVHTAKIATLRLKLHSLLSARDAAQEAGELTNCQAVRDWYAEQVRHFDVSLVTAWARYSAAQRAKQMTYAQEIAALELNLTGPGQRGPNYEMK